MLNHFSRVWLSGTLWTVALQAPPSMGFSRQEHWSGSSCPPPRDLPNPEMEFVSLKSPGSATKSLQSCPTLLDPRDSSPPGSPVPGILQARVLEWVPFPSPMQESEKWKWSRSSRARPSATPWTTAYQAPPSTGFSRQEYWSGVPLPYSGSWWWTQKPGMLQSMGSQRVGHDWVTELN